jgi:Uma2 family endonuclease
MATIRDLNWQDYYPPGVEPAWELALLFPPQGGWCIGDYFDLTERTHQLVEYTDGRIEVLAMPTAYHQRIVLFLINALQAVIHRGECGEVLMAPLPTILGPDKVREPDIVF